MRIILFCILAIMLLENCQEKPHIDAQYVINKFYESMDTVQTIEYRMHRVDTTLSDEQLDYSGFAVIEKDQSDTIFGFSYYGKMDGVSVANLHDYPTFFEIFEEEAGYRNYSADFRYIGHSGGQMIHRNIFQLESDYEKVSLNETDSSFQIIYEIADDTTFDITKTRRVYELNRSNYFLEKIVEKAVRDGKNLTFVSEFTDVKFNNQVKKTVKDYKEEITNYSVIQPKELISSPLLGKKLPALNLPDLFDNNKQISINVGKVILIDFWEVWCGWCISSFPEIEKIKNSYNSELSVFGILSDDPEDAKKMVEKKKLTFPNLIGNDQFKSLFGVTSYPRYYLVDKDGIVRKEYFGFSEAIEKDIRDLIGK